MQVQGKGQPESYLRGTLRMRTPKSQKNRSPQTVAPLQGASVTEAPPPRKVPRSPHRPSHDIAGTPVWAERGLVAVGENPWRENAAPLCENQGHTGALSSSDRLNATPQPVRLRGLDTVSYTHLTLPTKRIV